MNTIYEQSHQYKLWQQKLNRTFVKQQVLQTQKAAKSLTPAGQRLLIRMHSWFEQNEYAPMDRKQIATALERPGGLTAWDRRLLDRLCSMSFISRRRVALSTHVDRHGVQTGRGARYVYSMDIDTGFRLAMLRKGRRHEG